MKKLTIKLSVTALCLLLSVINQGAFIKAQSFNVGSTVVNVGVGFLSSIGYYSGSGVSRTPVLSLTGEYGIAKLGPGIVGAGIALGFQSASYTYNYDPYYYKEKWSTTLFGLRGTYHPDFLNTDKYDVYAVFQLSFDHFGYKFTSNDPAYNRYGFGGNSLSSYVRPYILVGGRYYFNKNIGVFAELGYDISFLKLGLAIKFDKAAKK
jgi:hypothetical protein